MKIGIDFDGTCVTHEFPYVGKEIGAPRVLKRLVSAGHKLILFTMRSDTNEGTYLTDALDWFKSHNIPLYGINTDPDQKSWTTSPKANADIYIDDLALGCPLNHDKSMSDLPFVNWPTVQYLLMKKGVIVEL